MINIQKIDKKIKMDFEIAGVTCDSREVKDGFIFVAINGEADRGEDYIPEAIERGAKAIVSSSSFKGQFDDKIVLIKDNNPRKRLSEISALIYPKHPEIICAVTGTNGKTSTTHFLHQLWQLLNKNSSSIGT
ncbi:MAG: Mur ligase domain-containing protein, partial [Pseudomonadota bacterium]|nr:Mur ligase domain-containing protein [Pseudomonadota bacterium]